MNKAVLLKLHRWVALVFALPLLAIILTGLLLSFEPIVVQSAITPGSVTVKSVEGLLQRYDPQGAARALFLRPHENTLTISGGRPGGGTEIDLRTNERVSSDATTLSNVFGAARQIHEHLLFQAGWLVTVSTIAMLALILIGIFMGVPRLKNNVQGWHKGVAWGLLPLVILSPLTGLLLALGVSFSSPFPAPASSEPPLPLLEAVRVLGANHDLSALTWVRPLGRNLVARVAEDGEMKTFALTREGAVPMARAWPRLIHEGVWGGYVLPVLNFLTSTALMGLLGTGVWIWARRQLRRSVNRRRIAGSA